ELFTRLDVYKTPAADMLEGGVAGIVNMRSARPFDYAHSQVTYQFQEGYGEIGEEWSPRGALMGSWRSNTRFGEVGVIAGVAGVHNNFANEGWESGNAGWTNANLSDAQCGAAGGTSNPCNAINGLPSGNGWSLPGTVPVGAGAGLVAGQTI